MTIYLDNSTAAPPTPRALSRMQPFFTDCWGVSSSPHRKGQELVPHLEELYQKLYALVGAQERDRCVLTSSGAESVSQVLFSIYRTVTLTTGKNHFLAAATDEAPALMGMAGLEQLGCVSKTIPVNSVGIITPEAIAESISPRTALVSLSWANGLTGVIQPLEEIAALCHQRGIYLHVEASHAIGRLTHPFNEIGADFISFNGEQLHAPRGTGLLFIRGTAPCSPLIYGGSDQAGLRGGGLHIAGLAALTEALAEAIESREFGCTETARMRDLLEDSLIRQFPPASVCFRDAERMPHCTSLLFPGVSNEALLFLLNRKGIYACMGGGNFQQLGLVLEACGIEPVLARSALSFSLSRYTTEEEVERAAKEIAASAQMLSSLSKGL